MAGLQAPEIPSLEVVGNGSKVSPTQISFTAENVGIILASTTTVKVAGSAHCPASGVKV